MLTSCREEVPLDREQFTRLLVEVHLVDATIEGTRGLKNQGERKNYAYYGDIFLRYGITNVEFDSCVSYYSRNTTLFEKIYVDVLDSLNHRLTVVNQTLTKLQAMDSISLFDLPDTLWLTSEMPDTTLRMDNLEPGKYVFDMTFRFDSLDRGLDDKLISYLLYHNSRDTIYFVDSLWYEGSFIRVDSLFTIDSIYDESGLATGWECRLMGLDSIFDYTARQDTFLVSETLTTIDTFKIKDIHILTDVLPHRYTWTQYVDSNFNSVVINFVASSNLDTLSYRSGMAIKAGLFKRYAAETSMSELMRDFNRAKRNIVPGTDTTISNRRAVLYIPDTLATDSLSTDSLATDSLQAESSEEMLPTDSLATELQESPEAID